jgi:hypothetical protein
MYDCYEATSVQELKSFDTALVLVTCHNMSSYQTYLLEQQHALVWSALAAAVCCAALLVLMLLLLHLLHAVIVLELHPLLVLLPLAAVCSSISHSSGGSSSRNSNEASVQSRDGTSGLYSSEVKGVAAVNSALACVLLMYRPTKYLQTLLCAYCCATVICRP